MSGSSLYERTKEDAKKEDQVNYGSRQNNQSTVGINYKKIWSESSFSNTSISYSTQKADAAFLNYTTGSVTSMANNTLKSFPSDRSISLNYQINLELNMDLKRHQKSFNMTFC